MDYKHTLNLPQTDFPMRGNLPTREPEILARWQAEGLYQRLLDANAGGERYLLHDGPPYANGDVHLGTALNKIIKDVIVKRQLMAGRHAPYVPGWDCHGMPIEHQVLRDLGGKARSMSRLEIRRRCRVFAEKYFAIQREQFQRLAVLGDWQHPYLTMTPDYEAAIVRMFRRLAERGFIYRGLRPVHWCATCSTALAEAEVEYSDHTSPSIYVRFPFAGTGDEAAALARGPGDADALRGAAQAGRLAAVIWTTTPWTLPANLAVCFNPTLDYVAVDLGEEMVIVAARLADAFLAATGLAANEGRRFAVDLSGLDGRDAFRHPLFERPSRAVFETHVTADVGTGCVHTAPGHGYEDFQVGQKYGLPTLTPVDAEGRFTVDAGPYVDAKVFETNERIVDDLRAAGRLVHSEKLAHSYPHCWRCKNPLIFRATEQWFLRIDHAGLRENAVAEIDRVSWVPKWGHDRISNMMQTRPDWCLSRQRAWGVPIPAFSCSGCNAFHADPAVIAHVEAIFRERGSDAWYELSESELLPPGYTCACGSTAFTRDDNILDVWFDAGCSHDAVLNERGLGWPADLYVEAVDQHRGWFQVSLITAVATTGMAPYRQVLTHGLILDQHAKKMSKSLGNVVSPDEVIKKHGADILRLLFASVDFTADTCFSQNLITPLLETYRKIRNTCRFLLGNLAGFDPARDAVPVEALPELDRWILHRGQQLLARSLAAYDEFAFHHVVQGLVNFCAVDLSALYLDVVKDRIYTSAPEAPGRRAAQTTLAKLLDLLVRVMAPILSYTADEIWSYVPGRGAATVFEAGLPAVDALLVDEDLAARWERLLAARAVVTKALEEARKSGAIGHSLDARVQLVPNAELRPLLASVLDTLPALFIVSQVELADALGDGAHVATSDHLGVSVSAARGAKCGRCWNYSEQVGTDAEHPELCERCQPVVRALPAEARETA
ncbi:MAG TPA: isoleucine--tRNA ligase [Candidatus Dormibacteraeota bacterium]|nr:isoleucine--tRNA ligase [Candidatus Dormibacteraeota bacterium]